MPSFQSPVPMSGRPCAPVSRLFSRALAQCSNKLAFFRGNCRLEESVALVFLQHRPFEELDHLVKHRDVASDLDIVGDDIGEPAAIIGDACTDTTPGFR
jgi:hypothetical protein